MKYIFSFLSIILLLAGCSSDPEERVSEPSEVTFSIFADTSLNPNAEGVSSPIEIQLFELEDNSMLLSADYHQIKDDFKGALKSNFIKSYDYVLTPGQFKFVSTIAVDERTNYIGIVAHFSDPENSDWKKTVQILNKDHLYHLFINLRDYEVTIKKVES